MSADASVTLTWADGEYKFRLPIGQLRELQDKTDAGPIEVLDRLMSRRWRVDDIRETLRLGLIGGGLKPVEALVLIKRYVDERPLMENAPAAQTVLLAALVGVKDDEVGKGSPEETEQTDGSASPSFMEQGPPSGSIQPRSMQ
jgi:hypothetical protein